MHSFKNIEKFKSKIFNSLNESEFEELVLEVFDFEIENNPIYATYAKHVLKNNIPNNIYSIPFLPIEFFKKEQIICKSRRIEEFFISSGTSGEQSKHLVSDISIYKESFTRAFQQFYGNINDYCILSLLPNYRNRENSSLIYMVDELISLSKHKDSGFYLEDYNKLNNTIIKLEKEKQKTILFGVSYALLDWAKKYPINIENTIIIETGGTKGKEKELLKEELHESLKNNLSVKTIHSEYGMTELLSQSYSKGNGIFHSPNWKKILIRDINDPLTILDNNKIGGINIIDLANVFSCPFIATQDLGKSYENGSFSVLGRFDNADIRGCNLLI